MPQKLRHRHLLALLVLTGLLLAAPAAQGTSPGLVVSQVYAAGGNAGATYQNDFVELLNRGSTAVDLSGWTVQYASASAPTWQPTALTGTVQPGRYYLVQLASAASIGAALPTADATDTTNLAVTGGKVALVHGTTALTCGATAGSCIASVADLVGYGSATDYEGAAAAPALSATTAAVRAGAGCTDTDANSIDFTAAAPTPRNSSSAAASCGGGSSSGSSQGATVDVDIQPVISIALEHTGLSFGNVATGDTPAPLSDHVTVVSNNAAGYTLTVHRTAFAPADLPLGLAIGAGGPFVIPIAPATDLLVGTTSARSVGAGDLWSTSIGFAAAIPSVGAGHYTSTVTFTVIAR